MSTIPIEDRDPRPHVSVGDYVRVDFAYHNADRNLHGRVGRVLDVDQEPDNLPGPGRVHGILVGVDGTKVLASRWTRALDPAQTAPRPQVIVGRPETEGRDGYTGGTDLQAMHNAINRTLSTVALTLAIFLMLLLTVWAFQVRGAINSIGEGVPDGPNVVDLDLPVEPPAPGYNYDGTPADECWNPGGGEVCAPGGADGQPGGE